MQKSVVSKKVKLRMREHTKVVLYQHTGLAKPGSVPISWLCIWFGDPAFGYGLCRRYFLLILKILFVVSLDTEPVTGSSLPIQISCFEHNLGTYPFGQRETGRGITQSSLFLTTEYCLYAYVQ